MENPEIVVNMAQPGDAMNKREAAEALDSLLLMDEVWYERLDLTRAIS